MSTMESLPIIDSMRGAPEEDLILADQFNRIKPKNYSFLQFCSGVADASTRTPPDSSMFNRNKTFGNRRFLRHVLSFFGPPTIEKSPIPNIKMFFATNKAFILGAINTYINDFSKLLDGQNQINFHQNDSATILNFIKKTILNYELVISGDYIPVIQIAPTFGPYHDRIQSNLIKRVINIFFAVFEINIRVNCTKAPKEKMSFVEKVQGGYCSTCAYSDEIIKYDRKPTYSKQYIKMLLFAAPYDEKYVENPELHDKMVLKKNHKILKGPLVNDARLTIQFSDHSNYFIIAHDLCKDEITVEVDLCGNIAISLNMVIACIKFAIDPANWQTKMIEANSKTL